MNELQRLSVMARRLADDLEASAERAPAIYLPEEALPHRKAIDDILLARAARRYLRLRRQRDQLFDKDLFADPAWDLLLDLFAAGVEERRVSVSSACIAACVPPTTALRWIEKLVGDGLVEREHDPDDRRRAYLRLQPTGHAAVARWLTELVAGANGG